MSVELFKHQRDYLTQRWDSPYWGLWWEMGSCKTLSILVNAELLRRAEKIGGLLIIAENGVHLNWRRDQSEYLPSSRFVGYSSYDTKWQREAIKDLFTYTAGLRILSINVEAFSFPNSRATKLAMDFLKTTKCMIAVDEATCIKNPKAARTKVVLALRNLAPYRRALSGTISGDKPFDVWSPLEFLQKGATGLNYFQFQKEHGIFEVKQFGPRSFNAVTGYKHLPEVKKLLEKYGNFVAKSDCLDLPPKLYETHECEMNDKQTVLYALVKKNISVEFNGSHIEPINAMAKLQYLHNIAIGFVKHDDGRIEWISESRLVDLCCLLELSGMKKTIIWSCSIPAINKIVLTLASKYGRNSYVEYHGAIPTETRFANVTRFQNDPECLFFVANQEAAGKSLTLHAAWYEIYFRNGYSLEDRLQSEDRAHRAGLTHSVTIIDMVVPKTADENVVTALRSKQDIASQIVPFLKRVTTTDKQ